jgi:hypothetical protein
VSGLIPLKKPLSRCLELNEELFNPIFRLIYVPLFLWRWKMKMKFIISLIMITLLSACNILDNVRPGPDMTQTLDAARTQAVQTVIAEIINQATATQPPVIPTPMPTATQPVLPTLVPTLVPTATETAVPATPTSIPTHTPTATNVVVEKPTITILAVEKNRAVTLQATDFPKDQVFTIRVGPFQDFFRNYVETGTINSGSGGSFKFTVLLPLEVRDVDRITVRLDSRQGNYAFNAFRNVDTGKVTYDATPVSNTMCTVSVSPTSSRTFSVNEDFDAVWTVKNTSGATWDDFAVDYKYISGVEMQKYEKLYDIPQSVKSNETIKIIVDMVAPDKAGTYTTHWGLVKGNTILCQLPLTIVVK